MTWPTSSTPPVPLGSARASCCGTLAPRESDGEFQINFLTNNFMGRLQSYALHGCFPYSMMNSPVRMGSIGASARAFLALAKTQRECCLFHAVSNHTVPEDSEYTAQALLRLGFFWQHSSDAYIKGFISALPGFGFFDPQMLIR